MTLSSFAARGGLSLSEIARINAEEGLRFPSAENPLADYPTHESLVYTSKNTSGFSLVQLRLMCTQRPRAPAARRQGQCQVLHDGLAQMA